MLSSKDISSKNKVLVKILGQQDYIPCWQAMQAFTNQRIESTPDEIWIVEHPPVFTLGQSGKRQHILKEGDIPLVQIDRGGQVTYHGPGQVIAYTLIDLKRKNFSIRKLVTLLERAVIDLLAEYELKAEAQCKAPGVYIEGMKICSLGLRVRRGYSYHGLALNVDMDLHPFSWINPCGYEGLKMTQMSAWHKNIDKNKIQNELLNTLCKNLECEDIYSNLH